MKTNLLFAVLVGTVLAMAGCSPDPKPNAYPKYDAAADFKDDAPANATVAGGFPSVFVDKDGKTIDLKEFRGKKSVVVVVLRGVPQSFGGAFCFHCLAQMSGLLAKKDEIARRGAEVVILFPGPAETVDQFLEQARSQTDGKPELPYPLVLDKDFAITDRLDIRGDLAKPSTYILDKKGDLVYAYVGANPTDRPSIQAVLNQLEKLQNAK